MKKTIISLLAALIVVPLLLAAVTYVELDINWMHTPKYAQNWTLSDPYFLIRKSNLVWDNGTGAWSASAVYDSGSTFEIRPTWNTNLNMYVFNLPQNTSLTSCTATLSMYDAADGSEAATDVPLWGSTIIIKNEGTNRITFETTPLIY